MSDWQQHIISDLTVLVLTLDEAPNIERTLRSVEWAETILVVDSGSSDRTRAIAESFGNATVLEREFTTHSEQWNFGLGHIQTKWTLAIDADYVLPNPARGAIERAMRTDRAGYRASFEYLIYGEPVRGSILPPRTILFRTARAHYWQDGHTQKLKLEGDIGQLEFVVAHDDRKPLSRWLASQIKYARQEALKLQASRRSELSLGDRLRSTIVLAPALVFLLTYVFRGGFLSGWRGLFYALQRTFAELLLSLYLLDAKLQSRQGGPTASGGGD
jgi:glycosyltransferase involved in cell wall biosynthesis